MAIYEKKNAQKSGGGVPKAKMLRKSTPLKKSTTGYTAVGTSRKTGEKTVRSGTLTPTSKSEFTSNGKQTAKKLNKRKLY
jgi:hypothetical protein